MRQYIFDGSWAGLLSAVFDVFERKEGPVRLWHRRQYQPAVFGDDREVTADPEKAARVGRALTNQMQSGFRQQLFRAFLSEQSEAYDGVFQLLRRFFSGERELVSNFGDPLVLQLSQIAHAVGREAHRMKAFVRFALAEDGWYVAIFEPDFNVLPLVVPFFRNRYADQAWLIYDLKRKYGVVYDKAALSEVRLTDPGTEPHAVQSVIRLHASEPSWQKLWQTYFQSTNIAARKNMKLHIRHVPKRYWKYLPEKQFALL